MYNTREQRIIRGDKDFWKSEIKDNCNRHTLIRLNQRMFSFHVILRVPFRGPRRQNADSQEQQQEDRLHVSCWTEMCFAQRQLL